MPFVFSNRIKPLFVFPIKQDCCFYPITIFCKVPKKKKLALWSSPLLPIHSPPLPAIVAISGLGQVVYYIAICIIGGLVVGNIERLRMLLLLHHNFWLGWLVVEWWRLLSACVRMGATWPCEGWRSRSPTSLVLTSLKTRLSWWNRKCCRPQLGSFHPSAIGKIRAMCWKRKR